MAMEKSETILAAGPSPAPMKFSRYRSVRKAAAQKPHEMPQPPLPNLQSASRPVPSNGAIATNGANPAINRSMSRYRRQRAATESNAPPQPPVPVSINRALTHRAKPRANAHGDSSAQRVHRSPDGGKSGNASNATRHENRHRAFNVDEAAKVNPFLTDSEEDEEVRQKHREDAMNRLTGGAKKHPESVPRRRVVSSREREAKPTDEHYQRVDGGAVTGRRASHEAKRLSNTEPAKPSRPADNPTKQLTAIDTSVENRFPGIDAPVSAVNSGERRVVVQYRKTSLNLRVTPSTTAQDLLFSAGDCLTGQIDPPKFILMESFGELGLERPLRTYENIRDVMNSWGHDQENPLIIVPGASLDALSLLDPRSAPAEQPAEVTLQMYYSQKPRKWDKRYITLRSDGQITSSKKEQRLDQVNVCHLSDFDIYSPTSSYLSNNVKPPKKICQAIKSQQKSSMFLTTENFVHFFTTNDKAVADAWYRAVQSWRSWYLVTKLGAGQTDDGAEATDGGDVIVQKKPLKPLLNLDSPIHSSGEGSDSAMDRSRPSKTKELFSMKKSAREHAPPPSSFPKVLSDDSDLSAAQSSDESPFTSSGLLGRTYSQRQKAMKEREEREKKAGDDPFTATGLVGSMDMRRQHSGPGSRSNSRSNTMTSTHAPDPSGLVKRSLSVKTKPLVDLTPVFKEPPQHIRKGRGVAVEPGVPLVEAATGLEPAGGISIPSATTWRRPVVPEIPTTDVRTRKRSNTNRSTGSQQHRPQYSRTAPASPTTPMDPSQSHDDSFIPNSLLARSGHAAVSGIPKGHGIATGDRNASKPLLDMSPDNPFAEGSLLRDL
ncbi:hypothetical protein BDV25DRAFT_152596 [Aspergillus avenaceus]|uniref:PH domain-containing protein n=1 Tax=Aspergillus avenaceus TaxID=36643 RepID=A0A5N6TYZ2_ASPAV|nr:hypothetical protein BDV25DRAFT_152596 [Aspergillus avenaceus]